MLGDRSFWTHQGLYWPCCTSFNVGRRSVEGSSRGLLRVNLFFGLGVLLLAEGRSVKGSNLDLVAPRQGLFSPYYTSFNVEGRSVEGSNRGLLQVKASFSLL